MAPPRDFTIALIKPDCATGFRVSGQGTAPNNGKIIEDILQRITAEGFSIQQRRTLQLTKKQVRQIYRHAWTHEEFDKVLEFMTSGPSIALVLGGEDAVEKWKALMGPEDPAIARTIAAQKPLMRGVYGLNAIQNAFYGSLNPLCALRDKQILFPSANPLMERALVIVKPSAVNYIDSMSLRFEQAGLFLMDQKQIAVNSDDDLLLLGESNDPEYTTELKTLMSSGNSHILLLEGIEATTKLELLLGSADPVEAKEHFPTSIRAEMGTTLVNNCAFLLHSSPGADNRTQHWFASYFLLEPESTLAIIKPSTADSHGETIEKIIIQHGFRIDHKSRRRLSREDAMEFYAEHQGKIFYEKLMNYMTSDYVIVMVLTRVKAIYTWRKCMGPTNSMVAKENYPDSIRGRFGIDGTRNATHGSDSPTSAQREIQLIFHLPVIPLGSIPMKEYAAKPIKYQPPKNTLHDALASGITELCTHEPRLEALEACEWLGRYLVSRASNNPPDQEQIYQSKQNKIQVNQSCRHPIDLGIPSLFKLHLVAIFGPNNNRTWLAKQIAKEYNYHYMDIQAILQEKQPDDDNMTAIVKAFKRCVWKRIIVDNCPSDLTFYLSFQKNVAPFAWITVVSEDGNNQHRPHFYPHAQNELPFQVRSKDELEFYDFFHRFGHLHYIPHHLNLVSSVTNNPYLEVVHFPFAPRIFLVHDKDNTITSEQWQSLEKTLMWTILDFPTLLEREIAIEKRSGRTVFTSIARTGENMPHELVLQLLGQSISTNPTYQRFLITRLPSHTRNEAFLTKLDLHVHASPSTQFLFISNEPFQRSMGNHTAFELRMQALGLLTYVWIGSATNINHLRDVLGPIISPIVGLFIEEQNNKKPLHQDVPRLRGYTQLRVKDALRGEILMETPLGQHIRKLVESNESIPDDIVLSVLQKHIYHKLNRRHLLEDFPHTVEQACSLSSEIGAASFVIRSNDAATPFDVDCISHLALNHPVVSVSSTSSLMKTLCRFSASFVLGDFDLTELDTIRLQRHFQSRGVHVLPLAHIESCAQALYNGSDHPMDHVAFVELTCKILRDRGIHRAILLGFPRTLQEAKAFQNMAVDCDSVFILRKKIIPIPHELTDEDYYSSDEEEKARRKNAPEPQISQLTRFYSDNYPNAVKDITFVDIERIYPSIMTIFQPKVVLAVGNKASGYHTPLRRGVNSSFGVYLHVPELFKKHIEQYPTSSRSNKIKEAFAQGRLVDISITMDLIREAIKQSASSKIVITGYPRVIGNTMPYIHDQMEALSKEIGVVDQLLHFTCSPEVLMSRVTKLEEVHCHTDAFNAECAPVLDYCSKLKLTISIVNADVSLDTLTQDVQTLFLT